jgi:SOS-response transcriptional repressor LexA
MYAYDKKLDDDTESYTSVENIAYDKVLAIDNIGSFIPCPADCPSASFAIKLNDSALEPKYIKGQYLFVEINSPLKNSEFGVFSLNGKIIIRKFTIKNSQIVLNPLNKDFSKIIINTNDEFYIVGKILGN